jgi:hypothetical protein
MTTQQIKIIERLAPESADLVTQVAQEQQRARGLSGLLDYRRLRITARTTTYTDATLTVQWTERITVTQTATLPRVAFFARTTPIAQSANEHRSSGFPCQRTTGRRRC